MKKSIYAFHPHFGRDRQAAQTWWKECDLEGTPEEFHNFYNAHRVHQALNLRTPDEAFIAV